jgi:tetratricopeptide (TPR) repeat protein
MENEKLRLGDLFYAEGKYDAALNNYLDALFQMEATPELYRKIGDCNTRLGDLENAAEYYQFAKDLGSQKEVKEDIAVSTSSEANRAIKKELYDMLCGQRFMHNIKALELINHLLESPATAADAVIEGDGHFRFIAYTAGKTFEVSAGEEDAEILIREV